MYSPEKHEFGTEKLLKINSLLWWKKLYSSARVLQELKTRTPGYSTNRVRILQNLDTYHNDCTQQLCPQTIRFQQTSTGIKMIWKAQLLPKIQLFLWKVMQNAVPTSENLQKRGLLKNTNSIRCGERETTVHLFFHCHFAQRVWELALWSSPANLTQALSFGEKLVASYQRINLPPVGTNINLFPWIVWNLWIVRNQLLFENMTFSLQDCLSKSVITAREWTTAQDAQPKITPCQITRQRLGWLFTDKNLTEIGSVRSARLLRSDRAQADARSLRSDRAFVPLGRYVATEHPFRSIATQRPSSSETSIQH
ncbi:hypothetical protein F2Q70_00036845 [Brassica cretica]|uniref:Reverse transcriptase zinc-binding domain-containing protein n=1 Tax=Brassica cretica TaxID=69181 RepID=A0A8S9JSV9_BRACR|nr:hypothetical protein F2Q70_00036845 [Brassica cretica]